MTNVRTPWFSCPGVWFWCAVALGVVLRFYCVVFTEGTYDVGIWQRHARDVIEHGLTGQYHVDPTANHPPFINELHAFFLRVSDATGIPFRILLRTPFATLDLGTAFLLLRGLGESRWRFLAAAAYSLNPLSIILSAYHGNTDSAIAFFLLLALLFFSQDRHLLAAVTLGLSLWIKLPGIVAIPAFVFALPKWRQRFIFAGVLGAVALVSYVPALITDPAVVWHNVFGYRAHTVQTTAGEPSWSSRVLLFSIIASPDQWPESTHAPILWFFEHGWKIAFALAILLSWLRRKCRSFIGLGATIAMSYVIIYTLSDGFSFQYFAWSLPFWFFLPRWFLMPAMLLVSAYIYFLYAFLCGNPWLLGVWDFNGHPDWPLSIIAIRNFGYLLFCAAAIWFMISSTIRAFPSLR